MDLLGVVGGPDFRLTYPNGDRCASVSTVYAARVVGGTPVPDAVETDALRWFARDEMAGPQVGGFAQATFRALGWI